MPRFPLQLELIKLRYKTPSLLRFRVCPLINIKMANIVYFHSLYSAQTIRKNNRIRTLEIIFF
ncbi:hypothetical protein BES34_000105 [Leptospira inadai serovar Lyme]|uniref:Lipoprotein n=1 Tax=Leptospira inadai serovar Lyme TaxID=293084 RepID=A0ABX4YN78_9LEPT|nr:hypothetical protein BES34_000105 [Leptospira inadai serovar Lyme]